MNKYPFIITHKRHYQGVEHASNTTVVGKNIDEALERFWVYKWKNGRDRRNELDILGVSRGSALVV